MCTSCSRRGQKEASHPLDLELQIVVGARNQTPVLSKSNNVLNYGVISPHLSSCSLFCLSAFLCQSLLSNSPVCLSLLCLYLLPFTLTSLDVPPDQSFGGSLLCVSCFLPLRTHHLSSGPAFVGSPMEESVAHAVAAVGSHLYISGGFGGVALGRLLALTLPPDPCRLLPSPEACNQSGACTWCHGACLSGDQAHR